MFEIERKFGRIKICQNTRLHSFELTTLSNIHCELYELNYCPEIKVTITERKEKGMFFSNDIDLLVFNAIFL